ncbi:MAG: class D sortase [Ruminococcus sp.]|nr:class D sortase [Ruminococcus sp.]
MSDRRSDNKHRSSRHREHSSTNKVLRTLTFVLTPFLVLFVVCGIFLLALIKPLSTAKPYLDMVFDGSSVQTSGDSQVNIYHADDVDLNIKEIDVQSEKDSDDDYKHYIIYPYYGDRYGTLNIENAGMTDIPVYCGTRSDVLERGAGWYNGSVFIGKVGNVVIAGHNHTYFFLLPQVKKGDIVTLETDYCKLTYVVTETVIFKETDLTYIRPTEGKDRLTLYTCWNNGRLGMSTQRLGVLCDLTKREWKKVEVEK